MKAIYIREEKETCDIIKRIIIKVKCFFNIINTEDLQEKKIYYLPIFRGQNIRKRKIKSLSNKIIKNLEKDECNTIVISKYLNTLKEFKNYIYSENINILNGRYLFKCLIQETIEYIIKRKNKNIEASEISILVNDINDINKELIMDIAKKVKTLSIITNHINRCKEIEKYLYNEFGILLNISNNKKSSLSNSEIMFNIDFPSELLNQYRICNKGIIINILEKIQIQEKKFNGINVNYFKIRIPKKYKIEGFKDEEVYESIIYKKSLEEARNIILEDKIRINKLIGNNGCIKDREFI